MRFRLDDLLIDTHRRTVERDGDPIFLTELSFDAFAALLEASPQALSYEAFAASVWKGGYVSPDTLAQRMALLRKGLGDDPKSPKYIRTVRNTGYAIIGTVEVCDELISRQSEPSAHVSRQGLTVAMALVAVVAMSTLALRGDPAPKAMSVANSSAPTTSELLTRRAGEFLSLHQSDETAAAIQMLEDALEADPDNDRAKVTLSFALTTRATKFRAAENDKARAEALARDVIQRQADNTNAWSALGYSLSSQGRTDEALAAYQKSYTLDPRNAPALSSAAHLHLVRGDFHQALRLEFLARETGGRSRYAEVQIAQILDILDHPEASAWYSEALRLNPGQVVVMSEIARWHLRQGNVEAALESLDGIGDDDAMSPSVLQLRSRALLALGDREGARRNLESAGEAASLEGAAFDAMFGQGLTAKVIRDTIEKYMYSDETEPEAYVLAAELASAAGHLSDTHDLLSKAVDAGWRDTAWLERSPYLNGYIDTEDGRSLLSRLDAIISIQKEAILSDPDFKNTLSPDGA